MVYSRNTYNTNSRYATSKKQDILPAIEKSRKIDWDRIQAYEKHRLYGIRLDWRANSEITRESTLINRLQTNRRRVASSLNTGGDNTSSIISSNSQSTQSQSNANKRRRKNTVQDELQALQQRQQAAQVRKMELENERQALELEARQIQIRNAIQSH
ncbi:Hypothetical protein R9X50_00502500 [Acrodontium crateriforme]|uniref:Uncharacterized protein n=1 Tax=Acrodontium crateriforme TaxID=150365 RepID=A0AAQ3M6D9_9PEZI|nr:Hypothetical protein R9X50_00502500 [Acrodontium crateriforme]